MTSLKKFTISTCFCILLSSEIWIGLVTMHHGNNQGNSGIEMLLAAGILAKLLHKHHHGHHQSHPIPIPIPIPVHHGGGGHEVIHHGGHHDHHGHGTSNYYDYAAYGGPYYAAPSAYVPAYY